ncbi:MAG: serine/threonine-protein kinase [Candidatus Bruticola sp.]
MSVVNRDITVVYYGKGTTYNLAFLSALERAGYISGGRTSISADGLGAEIIPDVIIIDCALATVDQVAEFIAQLRQPVQLADCVIVAVISSRDNSFGEEPSVKLLTAGASDVVDINTDPDVLTARVGAALRACSKNVPISNVRSSRRPVCNIGVGDTLGRYELTTILGIGGMGVVYKAVDKDLEREVAIKVLPDNADLSKRQIERFLREAEIMARLSIPETVHIFDVGSTPVNYIVMDLIQGHDLERLLSERLLSPAETVQIAATTARALHKIHQAGIVHRDLKPSNIFTDKNGKVRILDFGISKLLDAPVLLTLPGSTLGTPVYMAPEQLDSSLGEISARTDIYALGLIIYEAITGRVPFREDGVMNIIKEIVMGSPMSLRKVRPQVDPKLDQIVLKATARKPAQRYNSALEMADDLEKLDLTLPDYNTVKEGHAE